jgi:8-oxo-dGTP diphosphatase
MTPGPEVLIRGFITNSRGDLLLVQQRGRDWWFFPGGHLERNETVGAALRRELAEECEISVQPRRLIAVVEHAYRENDEDRTELNIVLEGFAENEIGEEESHLHFEWVPVSTLKSRDVRPVSVVAAVLARREYAISALLHDE